MFEKEHKRVMQDIRELDCGEEIDEGNFFLVFYKDSQNLECNTEFSRLNFEPSTYMNERGK